MECLERGCEGAGEMGSLPAAGAAAAAAADGLGWRPFASQAPREPYLQTPGRKWSRTGFGLLSPSLWLVFSQAGKPGVYDPVSQTEGDSAQNISVNLEPWNRMTVQ